MKTFQPTLLSIIELGGYPDFSSIYKKAGFAIEIQTSMRKALGYLKRNSPSVIVAEFNYQSGFRDRVSNLESLMAVIQQKPDVKVIVFFEVEMAHQFDRVKARFNFFETLAFPVDPGGLEAALVRVIESGVQVGNQ